MAEASPPDSVPSEVALSLDPRPEQLLRLRARRTWRRLRDRGQGVDDVAHTSRVDAGRDRTNTRTTSVTSARSRGTRRAILVRPRGGTAGDGFGSVTSGNGRTSQSLSSPGPEYSTYAFELFDSLPWWELEPSGADAKHTGLELIPSGNGRWAALDYIRRHARPITSGCWRTFP